MAHTSLCVYLRLTNTPCTHIKETVIIFIRFESGSRFADVDLFLSSTIHTLHTFPSKSYM